MVIANKKFQTSTSHNNLENFSQRIKLSIFRNGMHTCTLYIGYMENFHLEMTFPCLQFFLRTDSRNHKVAFLLKNNRIRCTSWFNAGSRIIENDLADCFFLFLLFSYPEGFYSNPSPNPVGQS